MLDEYEFLGLKCNGRIFSENGNIIVESSLLIPEDLFLCKVRKLSTWLLVKTGSKEVPRDLEGFGARKSN